MQQQDSDQRHSDGRSNFAAASKIAVDRLLSCLGNQYPIAFALAGKVGASPIPSRRRAAKKPPIPVEIAAPKEAMLQRMVLMRPTSPHSKAV